jgi:proprotein convertase subtilisin/kexin type 2
MTYFSKQNLIIPFLCTFLLLGGCSQKNEGDDMQTFLLLYFLNAYLNTCSSVGKYIEGSADPLYSNQWHLYNASNPGEDAGVLSVWKEGITGKCTTVSVVDDGVEISHEDLKNNISKSVSGYNYSTFSSNPTHSNADSGHGTSVAGIIASTAGNGLGGRGAAYDARIVGRNILEGSTDSDVADALTLGTRKITISNNSWGATDNTGYYIDIATNLWKAAIDTGISIGRRKKGTIFFWAAGNGGTGGVDNSNYDAQANYYGVLAICGVGDDGVKASYSERGANLWVCAQTAGTSGVGITTTDPTGVYGYVPSVYPDTYSNPSYTKYFDGTSAAAPLAAGVTALLLSKYPDLSWRDVREILATSARKNDPTDSDWTTNAAGYNINHNYGFGTIDAEQALSTAVTWSKITQPMITCTLSLGSGTGTISGNASSACSAMSVIEFVEINYSSNSASLGATTLTLSRNSSTDSILIEAHTCSGTCQSGADVGTIRLEVPDI